MDKFIANILGIYDYIQGLDTSSELIDSKVTHKQYLAYYLYRIICKYYNLISPITNIILIREKIFAPLNIPKNNEGCFALVGRMIKDQATLDIVINNMIKLLTAFENKRKGLVNENDEIVKDFDEFLEYKNSVEIINNDIVKLSKYLPGLSGSTPVPNVKELLKSSKSSNKTNNSNSNKKTNTPPDV